MAIAVGLGLYGLGDALTWWYALAAGAVVALVLWPRTLPRVDLAVARVAGALLVSVLALVGVDVLIGLADEALGGVDLRLPIVPGLLLALLIFAAVTYWFLRRSRCQERWARVGAATMPVLAILVTPVLVGLLATKSDPVPAPRPVASKLDLVIVGDGRRRALPQELPPNPALAQFDVRYSVGYARGETVRWTLVDGDSGGEALRAVAAGGALPALDAAPAPRDGADPVLLLLVDGAPAAIGDPAGLPQAPARRGEVERWRQLAGAAAPAGTPVFALLRTTAAERLSAWEGFVEAGRAVSAQALQSQTATDAAFRLAVAAPTSQADLTLAMAHRPVLLFDREERVPRPLSIDALINEGRIRLCHDDGIVGSSCGEEPIRHPGELVSGGTHLRFAHRPARDLKALAERDLAAAKEPPALAGDDAPPGVGTAIYVHPVASERDGRRLLYLDYWWYLPENPVDVGGGALCGAGLVIAGLTCQSHESDWEGLTVVVDRSGERPRVVAVHYAQHDSVVRYDWRQLRQRWDSDPRVSRLLAGVADASDRPLAFVAKGTHATYAMPCRDCNQVAKPAVGEAPHRGDFGWVGNDTAACGRSSCLQALPTRRGGEEPALWNAYDGQWGEKHCRFTYYCDSGSPPTAPGHQERYQHPGRYDGTVDGRERFRQAAFEE